MSILNPIIATVGISGGVSVHNNLTGKQGGTTNEFYHLTAAEYAALGSGGITDVVEDLSPQWGGNVDTNGKSINQLNVTGKTTLSPAVSTSGFVNQLNIAGSITATGSSNLLHSYFAPNTTITSGTHNIVATQYLQEPQITITAGSASLATTLYIAGAPTEGGSNYAAYINGGPSYFGGDVTFTGVISGPTVAELITDGSNDTALIIGQKLTDAAAALNEAGIESINLSTSANLNTQVASGDYSIKFGGDATASAEASIAIGSGKHSNVGAIASGLAAVAIGSGRDTVAGALATGSNAVAICRGSEATGASSQAYGVNAKATAVNSIQIHTGTNSVTSSFQVGGSGAPLAIYLNLPTSAGATGSLWANSGVVEVA